ncbi:MAG: hypothetical protein ACRDRR_16470 [Pseudonocardiaceae bacterium]
MADTAHHGNPDGTIRLVGLILRGTPHLPGAVCRGRSGLFDEVAWEDAALRAERRREAAALCRSCPTRPACPRAG